MLYEVDDKFLEEYDKIYNTLFTNYTHVATKARLNALESDLNAVAYQGYSKDLKLSDGTKLSDLDAKISKVSSDADFKVFQFIVLTGLSSYYGLSNLNEFVKSGNEFGYKDAFIGLKKLRKLTRKPEKDFEEASLERLLSTQRNCTRNEYFARKYYLDDIELVKKLLVNGVTKVDVSDELKSAIVRELYEVIDAEVDNIVSVYRNILAAAFGITRYKGVFTFDKTAPVIGLSDSYRYKVLEPVNTFRDKYLPVFDDMIDIKHPSQSTYTDRQFNASVIYDGSVAHKDKPVYFPHKVLELISLGSWTSTPVNAYKMCPNGESQNLNSYCEYLRTCFDNDIFNYCVYCCKADYLKLKQEIKDNWEVHQVLEDIDCPARDEFKLGIAEKLRYYVKCVTTVFVLTDLETEKKEKRGVAVEDILSFRVKVAYAGDLISNTVFCQRLSQSLFHDAYRMNEIEETLEETLNIGVHIRDYAYTFDSDKVYARPIFAYKALEALQAQGVKLSWRNMLLGKYADGSICRSAEGERINLLDANLHNIYSGSRSGKGVMCYNIFATAIASRIPIFYADRKPDTAVVLKSLCSKMFAVNGGQYSADIDLEKQFVPEKIKYRIPSYINKSEYLPELPPLEIVKGDYVYFRAFLLCLSLILFVDGVKNKEDPRYVKIAKLLENGAIFVLDEFSNFVTFFLEKYPVANKWFRGAYSSVGLNNWKSKLNDINEKSVNLSAKQNSDSAKEDQIVRAQGKLESALDGAREFDLAGVYFAQLADSYIEIMKAIPGLFKSAGNLVKQVQIFIIGQTLPYEHFDDELEFMTSTGSNPRKFKASENKLGKQTVPMIRALRDMGGDYIMGYQPDGKGGKPEYLAQRNKKYITSSMLTASRRCFCHFKPAALTVRSAEEIVNTEVAFGHNDYRISEFLNQLTYFKPFLILNNAVVPPENLRKPDEDNLGVSNALETKRKQGDYQYVGQCLTTCNRAGLTWEDLLNDNKDADGNFHSAVGFEGYIRQLCGVVPRDSMGISGDIMTIFVNEVFGYKDGTWMDFLADFRPEAMFTHTDFINAIDNPNEYSVRSRLSRSFFSDALTKVSDGVCFASIFEKELGTLAQYYNTDGESYKDDDSYDEDSYSYDDISTFAFEEDSEDSSVDETTYGQSDDVLRETLTENINEMFNEDIAILEDAYSRVMSKNPVWKQFWDEQSKQRLFNMFIPYVRDNNFSEEQFIIKVKDITYMIIYNMCKEIMTELLEETPAFRSYFTQDKVNVLLDRTASAFTK